MAVVAVPRQAQLARALHVDRRAQVAADAGRRPFGDPLPRVPRSLFRAWIETATWQGFRRRPRETPHVEARPLRTLGDGSQTGRR